MPDFINGPEALSAWRKSAGKSQTECAETLGVRQATWSEWEAGHRSPRIKHALAIAKMSGGAVPIEVWSGVEEAVPANETEEEAPADAAPTFQHPPSATGTDGVG